MIYNSVWYDSIDMENILADNEGAIIHNSEGHLHMFDKDAIANAVFDMETGKVTDLMRFHPIILNMILTYCMYTYQINYYNITLHKTFASLADSNNFRAIALSSLFAKIMDAYNK